MATQMKQNSHMHSAQTPTDLSSPGRSFGCPSTSDLISTLSDDNSSTPPRWVLPTRIPSSPLQERKRTTAEHFQLRPPNLQNPSTPPRKTTHDPRILWAPKARPAQISTDYAARVERVYIPSPPSPTPNHRPGNPCTPSNVVRDTGLDVPTRPK
ncbi:hypothetical protein BDV98DRAFT_573526 [Pterulicium gracile]|uniref:Uncharacterized protein n=1 Tax=Pterulicium gracile TaxID=1884261 RepID=A0A5C3QD72_9AGAR|nr:hypothetical protein BDV98DRAFT_573526 [Pterula gracilis]